MTVVRDIVAQCDGLLSWGGDAVPAPREGRFQLAVPAADAKLRALAKRLDTDAKHPGRRVGAGTALPFTPTASAEPSPFAAARPGNQEGRPITDGR